jgi:hypothetical protein
MQQNCEACEQHTSGDFNPQRQLQSKKKKQQPKQTKTKAFD